jgi:hypothetical protein
MSNYSEEDKIAFRMKDILNARMSALKAASLLYEGKSEPSSNVENVAGRFFTWLSKDQNWSKQDVDSSINFDDSSCVPVTNVSTVPTPTLIQQGWLDKIKTKHGFSVEQVYKTYKKYPATKEEAIECVRLLKKENLDACNSKRM